MLAAVVFLTFATATEPPALSDETLARMTEGLGASDPAARLAAAQRIASLPPEAFPTLVARLDKARTTAPDNFRKLFLAMWGQVPNWKGFDPMWIHQPEPPWTPPPRIKGQPRPKRPPPHDPEALDWLKAINEVDLDKAAQLSLDGMIPPPPLPKGKRPPRPAPPALLPDGTPAPPPPPPPLPTAAEMQTARTEALEVVALMRAIAASKRMDAVDPLFHLAFELDGVFRDECGRQIRSIESTAVPALIRLQHQPSTKQLPFFKQRRYASYQLDRMDRARPSKAIATASDDRVRAEIIHAYGEARALDAVEAVLAQVDAQSHRVRKEARWTWLRYVTGKAPPPAPKRKRKLPGGKEETEEKPDYLTYREIATLALQKQLAELNLTSPEPNASAKQMTEVLFDYYDKRRAAEWDLEFAAAKEKEQSGDLQAATDLYGWILAHDPSYSRRAEMAEAFARWGDQLKGSGDIGRALGAWRQAVDLAPDAPESRSVAAKVALQDGLQALAQGSADIASFRRALELEPSLTEAHQGLDRARWLAARRRWAKNGGALAGLGCLAALLWLLWRRTGAPRNPQAL
jgi:hypothetical protein